MKKAVLTFVLGVLCAAATFAQISVLPKIGLNLSNVAFESDKIPTDDQRGVLAGLAVGAEVNVKFTGPLSFQTGLLYSERGYGGREELSGKYRLNYLEIPLLGKATLDAGPIDVYVNGGFGLGYLLGGYYDGDLSFGIFRFEDEGKIKLSNESDGFGRIDANRLDVGLLLGGGVNYSLIPKVSTFLDLRYNHGLTDYDREEISKHRTFTIAIGMEFSL